MKDALILSFTFACGVMFMVPAYKEVTTALGKRIKMELKVDVPTGEDGKPIWWHLLFNGGLKDNAAFEWSLKNDLRTAIKELIETGTIQEVHVQAKKELQPVEEEQLVKIEKAEEKTEAKPDHKKDDGLSAFDRLFEAIMSPTPTKEKTVDKSKDETENIVNTSASVEKTVIMPNVEKSATSKEIEQVKEDKTIDESTSIQTAKKIEENVVEPTVKQEESDLDYKARIKKECIEYYGAICDLCGFDFGYTYGEKYEDCIEVHNIHGHAEEIIESTHPIQDLIPVCCNCHRIIHSQNPPISVEKMRKMVKA